MTGVERARQLARLVAGLRDTTLAVAFLRHELSELPPADAAAVLASVAGGADAADAEAGDLLLLCCVALAEPGLESLRAAIADEIATQGEHDAARMLTPVAGPDDQAPPVPDFGKGRPLTLGERKSLARRRDRNVIARVMRDPHPDVIRILLGNPALTEADVVRLCALRPVAVAVLREVFRQPRWVVRYGVRIALVKNPATPLDVALAIVPTLRAQDARDIAASPELDPSLRRAAARSGTPRTLH